MTSRRIAIAVALLAMAGLAWWLEPWAMHSAAEAIRKSGGATVAGPAGDSEVGDIEIGKPAPDFTLRNADGDRVKLSSFRGKVVVLNFWATWCGPCKYEIPWFIEFQRDLAPQGFTVLGVSMDQEGWQVVRPFVAAEKMNYPVVLGNEDVNRLYGGIDGIPTTLIIGRDGKIGYLHPGLATKAEYLKEITTLLRDRG